MKYWALIVLIGFMGMAVFGFTAMNHEGDHMARAASDCPIISVLVFTCTPSAVIMAIQHITAFQSFSNTPLVSSLSLLLVLAVLALLAILQLKFSPAFSLCRSQGLLNHQQAVNIKLCSTSKVQNWLSLLEHSPATF